MITSINDRIRKNIINMRSKELTKLNLERLSSERYEEVISIFLLDYYKINFFKGNFNFFDDFKDTKENIIKRTLTDEEFLISIMESSIIFKKLCTIDKIILLEELTNKNQDEMLMKISKLHLLDKISYNFDYDLESFKEYYNDYMNRNKRHPKKEDISRFIATKLDDYKVIRYDEFQKIVLEFIKVYYKWNIFIRGNCPKISLDIKDILYLDLIKSNKIDVLIEYIGVNVEFLTTIIDSYLFYTTGNNEISKKIVDDYFYNTVDEETQKKLKLKRD